MDQLYKVASIALSPNITGQILVNESPSHPESERFLPYSSAFKICMLEASSDWLVFCNGCPQMGLMVKPPRPGDYSYPLYAAERYRLMIFLPSRIRLIDIGRRLNLFRAIFILGRRLHLLRATMLIVCFGICSKGILESLRKRAHLMTDGFNACINVECNFTEGCSQDFLSYFVFVCKWSFLQSFDILG